MSMRGGEERLSTERFWVTARPTMISDSACLHTMVSSMLVLWDSRCRKRNRSQKILVISAWMGVLLLLLITLRSMPSSARLAQICNVFQLVCQEQCLVIALLEPERLIQ